MYALNKVSKPIYTLPVAYLGLIPPVCDWRHHTVGVKKNFSNFRSVELPFPSETPFIYRWNSFRSVYNLCRTCVRARAVIREMRRPHCEDISSSTYVGTAFSLFRVCATKKPCFAPPLASLYRVCGGRGTRNSQLNRNGTE